MQSSPSILQLKKKDGDWENKCFCSIFCPVTSPPFYWYHQYGSTFLWSPCLQCRSLSNQYQNENISPFHAEHCTVFRGSLGEPETNFLTFCLWCNIYYYYSNHWIALTEGENTFHTDLITLFCGERCSLSLLISENVVHPPNCQTSPTRQIDRFFSNEF